MVVWVLKLTKLLLYFPISGNKDGGSYDLHRYSRFFIFPGSFFPNNCMIQSFLTHFCSLPRHTAGLGVLACSNSILHRLVSSGTDLSSCVYISAHCHDKTCLSALPHSHHSHARLLVEWCFWAWNGVCGGETEWPWEALGRSRKNSFAGGT